MGTGRSSGTAGGGRSGLYCPAIPGPDRGEFQVVVSVSTLAKPNSGRAPDDRVEAPEMIWSSGYMCQSDRAG